METPICVADAKTFVDNIHDIKRWIYDAQLRLVVPSCTEQVVQIYQKSKETKPTPKEAPRPKSFGKPAKIEYPLFDINPLVAKNFLARLTTWKGEDAASEQREFFQEKENHGAVSFQQATEQYTPWKDLEVEEEKPQVVDERPTTWAEALRRKQNLANGIVENLQAPKGPARPKLVAKAAGTEVSPWKIKRDAPKISVRDVPAHLRPLMSCALWRLHESIDRNDSNELFLLSDQTEIRTVARKLNVTVRSTKELGVLVAAKAKRPELDVFGDLEREFGIRTLSKQTNAEIQPKAENDHLMSHGEEMNDSISSDQTAKTENSHVIDERHGAESEQHVSELSGKLMRIGKNEDSKCATEGPSNADSRTPLVEGNAFDNSAAQAGSTTAVDHSALDVDGANGKDTGRYLETEGQNVGGSTPDAIGPSLPHRTVTPAGSPPPKSAMPIALPVPSSAAMQTPPASTEADNESDDSGEDVVVFVPQPKRSSVQKKPAQQVSRPSTPLTQPQHQKLAGQSPKSSPPAVQHQPKAPGRGRNHMIVSHNHPQPTAAPTIIDPDSFGRSFAVNPNPTPRTLHNPRSQHRPRPSAENALFPQGPRGSRQTPSRTHSPRISPTPEPAEEATRPQSSHLQRTSPQTRPKPLANGAVGFKGRGSDHAHPGIQLPIPQKSLNARMVESEEFVPRSAFKEASLDPIGTPKATPATGVLDPVLRTTDFAEQNKTKEAESSAAESDDFVPRSTTQVPPRKQQIPKSRVLQPNAFVPRNAMPTAYKQRVPDADAAVEPRASMPDVQYVLKSGSTRAATRGRGRLWIPS